MGDRQWFALYVLVCLEVGVFLVLVPWSAVWERNFFLEAYPRLRPFLLDPAVRGAVAGLGLANVYVGLDELFRRWARRTSSADDTRRLRRFEGGDAAARSEPSARSDRDPGRARTRDETESESEGPLVATETRR